MLQVVVLAMVPSQRVSAALISTYSFPVNGSTSSYDIAPVYDGSLTVTASFNLYPFTSGSVVVPSNASKCYVSCGGHYTAVISSGAGSYTVGSSYLSTYGSSFNAYGSLYKNNYYNFYSFMDCIPGQTMNALYFNVIFDIGISPTVSNPCDVDFYFTLDSLDLFFYDSEGLPATVQDLDHMTDDLTNGFDNSQGNAAAEQLGSEINNYIQQEDALYDQMQYDVPEVDIASDGQAIMLASNFLQSVYVSDSFISKCVTFVLTFGLIMYIIGWLKKKSG